MKIKFYSYTPSGNVKFETEGILNGSTLSFIDKSNESTTINLIINEDNIHLNRIGNCTMDMYFEEGVKSNGHYINNEIEFDFSLITNKLEILENKISIYYEFFINKESYGLYKIFILK